MAINSDTDINLALLQLGKNANRYRLDQNVILLILIHNQQMMNLTQLLQLGKMQKNIKLKEQKQVLQLTHQQENNLECCMTTLLRVN